MQTNKEINVAIEGDEEEKWKVKCMKKIEGGGQYTELLGLYIIHSCKKREKKMLSVVHVLSRQTCLSS